MTEDARGMAMNHELKEANMKDKTVSPPEPARVLWVTSVWPKSCCKGTEDTLSTKRVLQVTLSHIANSNVAEFQEALLIARLPVEVENPHAADIVNKYTEHKGFTGGCYNEHRIISLQQYTPAEFDSTWRDESS